MKYIMLFEEFVNLKESKGKIDEGNRMPTYQELFSKLNPALYRIMSREEKDKYHDSIVDKMKKMKEAMPVKEPGWIAKKSENKEMQDILDSLDPDVRVRVLMLKTHLHKYCTPKEAIEFRSLGDLDKLNFILDWMENKITYDQTLELNKLIRGGKHLEMDQADQIRFKDTKTNKEKYEIIASLQGDKKDR